MIVFSGGHASGFRNIHDYDSYDVDGTRLFHVRGFGADDMRAVQVPEVAASLNSDDVFVLETPSCTYIWNGVVSAHKKFSPLYLAKVTFNIATNIISPCKTSSDHEKAMGVEVANLVSPGRDQVPVNEGEEPDSFWDALGGKGPYTTVQPDPSPLLKPRLFHCVQYTASGRIRVEEIKPFKQGVIIVTLQRQFILFRNSQLIFFI